MKQSITHTRLAEVCEVIEARMGLHFPVERWDLFIRNLAQASAAFGFEHLDEFIDWLLTALPDQNQIKKLATFLTISETYFWREPQVFKALTDFIIPGIIKAKHDLNRNIRIWSAGCSTGEEPYSLAIALRETIPDIKDWKIQILATDMNPAALEKAEKGIYTQWSFRNSPGWIKVKYFQDLGEGKFRIIPQIRNMVTFANLNLAADNYPDPANNTHAIDILFCRNVLMYFSDEWVSHISQKLYQSIQQDGWFAVASCELSSQRFPQFSSVNFPGAVVYRKGGGELPASITTNQFQSDLNNFLKKNDSKPNKSESDTETALLSFSEFFVHEIEMEVLKLSPVNIPENTSELKVKKDIASEIRNLANEGNLIEALALCEVGIKEDKLAISLYFLQASIFQELNKTVEAITSLKQAIYMDHDFLMGHFALGNLYHRQGNLKFAMRYFSNALDLLKNLADDDILPESEGLSIKYIREIISANIKKQILL